jgi:formylglycine-generating enzyme required for sulfatase activity
MNVSGWLMTVAVLMSLSIGRALAGETATAVATITAGFVTAITVTSGGSGYTSEPAVTVTGGGGSGATAKAILSGDKVATVVVLTAGSGYSTAPTVVVEAPPKALGLRLRLIPELTIQGPAGSKAQVESAASLSGPWTVWTNVVVNVDGVVLVDLSPGSVTRFYRALEIQDSGQGLSPVIPEGFVQIHPGTYLMGSPTDEIGRSPDEVQHTVILNETFWISDHEVTQKEYSSVMGTNPSNWKGTNLPVERVTWNDAVAYCLQLTARERELGRISSRFEYRLPTEAEWEYAARAGTSESRYGQLSLIAWYSGTAGDNKTHEVKKKQANAWGLYDMLGNVWEWCADWDGAYPTGVVINPVGPSSGSNRIQRGGGWGYTADFIRLAGRNRMDPGGWNQLTGFRPVLSSVR